jgi:hypothetical protein
MKIFKEAKPQKSWSIELRNIEGVKEVNITIVDSNTGEWIGELLRFLPKGILLCKPCNDILREKGYDPNEHGDIWDVEGKIIVI